MSTPRPHRPEHLPDYSEMCLQALVDHGLADKIALGGALGLLHYLDYRTTHDVDAWWAETVTETDRRQVLQVLEDVLRQAVQTHLARIAQHRRLEQITDPDQQHQAEAVRTWYMGEFLDAAG